MAPVIRNQIMMELPPLYRQIMKLIKEKRCYQEESCYELGVADLLFSKEAYIENSGYYCTPENTLSFARTGVDGESFSFLVQDGTVNASSPIICTAPAHYAGSENVVIAKNFSIFMRLVIRYGGCALVGLVCNPEEAITVYTSEDLSGIRPERYSYTVGKTLADVLDLISTSFQLEPYIYTRSEFEELQQTHIPLLVMPPDYEETD